MMSSQVDRDRYWEVISHALRKYFSQDKLVGETRLVWLNTMMRSPFLLDESPLICGNALRAMLQICFSVPCREVILI